MKRKWTNGFEYEEYGFEYEENGFEYEENGFGYEENEFEYGASLLWRVKQIIFELHSIRKKCIFCLKNLPDILRPTGTMHKCIILV